MTLMDEAMALAGGSGHVNDHERERPGGSSPYRATIAVQLAVASALAAWAAPAPPRGADCLAAPLGAADGRRVDADALVPLAPGSRLAVPRGAVLGD